MKALYAYFLLFLASLALASCTTRGELGSGKLLKEARQTTSFQALHISGDFEVIIKQGPQESVFIEADNNLLKLISSSVTNGILTIEPKEVIRPSQRIKVFVTVSQLSSIDGAGAVEFNTDGTLYLNDLKIDGSGATKLNLDLVCKTLTCDFSGSSEMTAKGKADQSTYNISGGGSIAAADFEVKDCTIDVSGAGEAKVFATSTLDVSISGAGEVLYKGNPKVTQDISGAGQIKSL